MTQSIIFPSCLFPTAPCLPDRVVADLDCNVNSFAVQWRGTTSDLGAYTAIAIGSDNSRATCDSTETNCAIQNLKCGLTYSVVVTSSSIDCGTIDGSDYSVQSGSKSSSHPHPFVSFMNYSYIPPLLFIHLVVLSPV